MTRLKTYTTVLAIAALAIAWTDLAYAAPTEEQKCQAGRNVAAGSYARCQANALAKLAKATVTSPVNFIFQINAGKCRDRHRFEWLKLQVRFPATSCAAPRFVDNGNGTVTDNLTGLDWEMKSGTPGASVDCSATACSDPHDVANAYQWCLDTVPDFVLCDNPGEPADGGAFTDFLAKLNDDGAGCFAGQCDWRLPTRDELQTIVSEPYLCSSTPCINPIFGPTQSALYGTSTATKGSLDASAVAFDSGFTGHVSKYLPGYLHVRAVRGGE